MNRFYLFIIGLSIMILSSASLVDSGRQAALGRELPQIALYPNGSDAPVMLKEFEGKWVILSFWASTDAASRLNQSLVNGFVSSYREGSADDKLEFISVNFDDSALLAEEIIRIDSLSEGLHFSEHNSLRQQDFRSMFRMQEGLRTFLINPKGELVAADPTVNELRTFFEG